MRLLWSEKVECTWVQGYVQEFGFVDEGVFQAYSYVTCFLIYGASSECEAFAGEIGFEDSFVFGVKLHEVSQATNLIASGAMSGLLRRSFFGSVVGMRTPVSLSGMHMGQLQTPALLTSQWIPWAVRLRPHVSLHSRQMAMVPVGMLV
jgi:hypothetical protein